MVYNRKLERWVFLVFTLMQGSNSLISKCVTRRQKVTMTCPDDHVIYTTPVYLGSSSTDKCKKEDGDCTGLSIDMDDGRKVCHWKQACKLLWDDDTPMTLASNTSCQAVRPNYVMYDNPTCVHEDRIIDIHSDTTEVTEMSGVIRSSQHYPYHYKDVLEAYNEKVLKARVGYVLVLYIDDLRAAGQDSLRVHVSGQGTKKDVFYNRTARDWSVEVAEEDVYVVFTLRDMDKAERGFIMRFEYRKDWSTNKIQVKNLVRPVDKPPNSALSVRGSIHTCITRRDSMALNCPDGDVIFKPDVTTGVSNSRTCVAEPGDCQGLTHNLITQVNKCYWRGHCDLTWTKGVPLTMTRTLNCLAQLPDYITLKGYQCIPKKKVFDICDNDYKFINASEGLIRSHANYPWHYQTKQRVCRKYIPINRNYGLRMYTEQIDLDPDSKGDKLKFFADSRGKPIKTVIGGQRASIQRAQGCVMIEFRISKRSKGGKGFILRFEAAAGSNEGQKKDVTDYCGAMMRQTTRKPKTTKKPRKQKKKACKRPGGCSVDIGESGSESMGGVVPLGDDGNRIQRKFVKNREGKRSKRKRKKNRKRRKQQRKRKFGRKRKTRRRRKKIRRIKFKN